MTRSTILALVLAAAVPAAAQQAGSPQIQNGKVEVRRATSIDREIAAASPASATEPSWVAWRVPMVDGDRDMCSWYSDRLGVTRAMFIDDGSMYVSGVGGESNRPQVTAPKGPIPLEAGTGLVILARVVSGRVERLRTAGDDCPMDAGGRTVIWLEGVTPAESLRYLGELAQAGPTDRTLYDVDRRNAETAVRAIGHHRDAAANAILDRIATDHRDTNVRRQAASALASLRGAHGVATVSRLIASSKSSDDRRALTATLGSSRDASAIDALRKLVTDEDARVRAEAVYYFVVRGGAPVIPDALKIVAGDKDENVRRRATSAIGRLPSDAGVPHLIQIARTSPDLPVRKEAMTALGQSKDPRALAFMEEVIKR